MGTHRRARRITWMGVPVALALAALALAAIAVLDRTSGRPPVEIGTAVQTLGAAHGAALRSTEDVTYDDTDLELVAVYAVRDATLEAGPGTPADHRAAWGVAEAILPVGALAGVRQLNVVTDGPGGTLAMVHRSGMATDRWILSVDPNEPVTVLEDTLVHELAHLLTLRSDDLSTAPGACDGVRIELGCARAGSALAEWAGAFWPDPTRPAHHDAERFVSSYAASAVHEDLAETFLAYVSGDYDPTEPVLAAKVAFLEARPELASAADDVRSRLRAAAG